MFLDNLLLDHERRSWLDEKLIRLVDEDILFFTTLESLHANIPQAIEVVGSVWEHSVILTPHREAFYNRENPILPLLERAPHGLCRGYLVI